MYVREFKSNIQARNLDANLIIDRPMATITRLGVGEVGSGLYGGGAAEWMGCFVFLGETLWESTYYS